MPFVSALAISRTVVVGSLLPSLLWPRIVGCQSAEGRRASNAVYLEVLGNGGAFSLNYERALPRAAAIRIGAAMWTTSDLLSSYSETTVTSVPVMLGWLRASGAHHLELGAGVVAGRKVQSNEDIFGESTVDSWSDFISLTGTLGYRRQRRLQPGDRIAHVFRLAFTPFFGFGSESGAYPDRGFFPSAGISYGLAF